MKKFLVIFAVMTVLAGCVNAVPGKKNLIARNASELSNDTPAALDNAGTTDIPAGVDIAEASVPPALSPDTLAALRVLEDERKLWIQKGIQNYEFPLVLPHSRLGSYKLWLVVKNGVLQQVKTNNPPVPKEGDGPFYFDGILLTGELLDASVKNHNKMYPVNGVFQPDEYRKLMQGAIPDKFLGFIDTVPGIFAALRESIIKAGAEGQKVKIRNDYNNHYHRYNHIPLRAVFYHDPSVPLKEFRYGGMPMYMHKDFDEDAIYEPWYEMSLDSEMYKVLPAERAFRNSVYKGIINTSRICGTAGLVLKKKLS
ncbi:MAG: hypothetical protein LBH43_20955 [Treponema sp.]|jgi:hypothetical protein|nr:hypothetical protein [Treponema sp.]